MGSMEHLTFLMIYCVILYALSETAGHLLISFLSALRYSLTPLQSLRRSI